MGDIFLTSAQVYLWDVKSGRKLPAPPPNSTPFVGLAFSPDSKTLAMTAGYNLRFWDVETGSMKASFEN